MPKSLATAAKKPLARRQRDIRVLVRRDPDGYVFSEVRNMEEADPRRYLGNAIVIDRQKGRHLDSDSVISRAQTLAALLEIPYDEDLTQQCRSDLNWAGVCGCPRCVEKRNARAKKTR